MPKIGSPTIDQLQVFVCVVEEGGFAAAARRLGRAVSAISYSIATLEAQLGLVLFNRQGSRKSELTAAGRSILMDARLVTSDVQALRARALGLQEGVEAEVALALDVMIPLSRVTGVLRLFREAYPSVTLRLFVEALGGVAFSVLKGESHLGISGPDSSEHPDLERMDAGSIQLLPVASPTHPLARAGAIGPGATRSHLQLVLTDRSNLTEGREFGVTSPRTWRLADLGAKHELLKEGIGWGNMPVEMVEEDLKSKRLVVLQTSEHPGPYRLSAVWRRDFQLGPATQWIRGRLLESLT